MRQVRRGIVALGLLLALVPLSAQAEDGNQAAIDKARAEKTALDNLSVFQQVGSGPLLDCEAVVSAAVVVLTVCIAVALSGCRARVHEKRKHCDIGQMFSR